MSSSYALYSVSEIRAIEQAALAALPPFTLMQRAGQAAAAHALAILGTSPRDRKVLVLAGPGNNGGDALEAAACLARSGLPVTVLLHADLNRQSEDSRRAYQHAQAAAVHFADPADFGRILTAEPWALAIDGLFGIGLARAISPPLQGLVELLNSLECPVLALDVPSGLDADTGNIVGAHGTAVRATETITFIADKPGLHTCDGRDYAGRVAVASLDIYPSMFGTARARLNHPELFASCLRPRRHNSHKGSFGDVIVAGGAHGMCGAAVLAARASAKCGAGRVFAAFLDEPPAYDSMQPELMCRRARDMDFSSGTVVIGPGLGASGEARETLVHALAAGAPLVIDADALNLIASGRDLQQALRGRRRSALLTPHPLEAARLLGTSAAQVQADRLAAARALAAQLNSIVILKGSGSVIAQPSGEVAINTTGNAALATAGTGDVLAGICGALLAQGWPEWHAALAACWLHGHAADTLVAQGTGPVGLTASELIPSVRTHLNRLTEHHVKRRATG